MNEEIKLNKRQPTWNYILNDVALYSLMIKVIHSEYATSQEKFDFMYQIELLQQENARLKEFKKEHEIMKKILIEKGLWETLLNDDRFLEYLREEN